MSAPGSAPRAAVLTISTSRARGGNAPDESGEALVSVATGIGAEVVARELLADGRAALEERLRALCDGGGCELILTTGGTGLAPDDLTPEATLAVAERRVPGIAEAMRLASRPHTANWMLARNVAVIRGTTLIVNFPGSPRAITETGEAVAAALPHALRLLRGDKVH